MMLEQMNKQQLVELKQQLEQNFADYKALNLKLNMARGKPSPQQLDLSMELLQPLTDIYDADGVDVRNYGGLTGIPEAKRLFGDIFGIDPGLVIIGGSSSLNLMYDMVNRAYTHGVLPQYSPWCKLDKVKFLCPSPGYDRHFAITEDFGIEMIPVDMHDDGPDMDMVEGLVASDDSIKGIWCVPMYSNPDGITYSDEVVRRFASLQPAAADFRIFWDNAYCVHHLDREDHDTLLNLYKTAKELNKQDMVYMFASTSKVTLAGAGISAMAMSETNQEWILKHLSAQIISYDKVNQLRHCRYLPDLQAVEKIMDQHGQILKPKFDLVLSMLDQELSAWNLGIWREPKGGYFVSFYAPQGCAKRIVALCREAGVVLTNAGAAYPYGKDPQDSHIRIAPSFPSLAELKQAMQVFCDAVKLAAVEKFLCAV